MTIAFYAPMKSPNHRVPSGDRTMARGILAALSGMNRSTNVMLVSEFQSRDGTGSPSIQTQLLADAEQEADRLLRSAQAGEWTAWVTYHNYYKAPDLLGPSISKKLGIPYLLVEASRSPKRLEGPWESFAKKAEAACDVANVIFYMTDRDFPGLKEGQTEHQTLTHLKPFLNRTDLPSVSKVTNQEAKLLAVGMLRHGDKAASYKNLAQALSRLKTEHWNLTILGGGPAEDEIRALFSPFGGHVEFKGLCDSKGVERAMRASDIFVWPGVNEAFGMVYLEAQALGLPVVAENRLGVADVVGPASQLVEPNNPLAFAQAVDATLENRDQQELVARASQAYVRENHLLSSATQTFSNALAQLVKGPL